MLSAVPSASIGLPDNLPLFIPSTAQLPLGANDT